MDSVIHGDEPTTAGGVVFVEHPSVNQYLKWFNQNICYKFKKDKNREMMVPMQKNEWFFAQNNECGVDELKNLKN